MKQELEKILTTVLTGLDLSDIHPNITVTDDVTHGDYATNVAFQAAKVLGKSPLDAAELIAKDLRQMTNGLLEKVEVAKPGFINFTLSNQALLKNLSIEHKILGSNSLTGSKVMIEFTDPNPFKEFHIGHLYSNIVGESIARLLEATGAQVRRVCYQGDVGLHVAKSLWGINEKLKIENRKQEDIEKKSLEERVKFLGEAYALGATRYEEDDAAKQEIIALNKKVYEKDGEIMPLYLTGRGWSLDYFEAIYARLGTKFTTLYFESEAGPVGLDLVKEYLGTVFKESEGAVIFAGEDHGLHTRVFINSLGLPTYEAKELGLAVTKYKDFPFDQSIMVTGNEINEYFKVLLKALSLIKPEIASKMKHLSHGMVRLPEGKMSSRTGKIVTGEWLLDEAVVRARSKIAEVKGEGVGRVESSQEDEVAETVGVGAVKWALLKSGLGKDIEFSFDESVSFEGNSGPYLQYSYVRTQSLLSKSQTPHAISTATYEPKSEERALLVLLCQYSDIVQSAAEKYSPSTLATYLFNLAQGFNNFYQKFQILKEEGETRDFRLELTVKVGQTLKNGLNLLGIQTPERM